MEIRYFVCGIGYDADDCVTDYDREFGDFDTLEEAREKFDEAVREAEDNLDEFFCDDELVAYWKIQLEKCDCTEECDECVDVLLETDIYKEERNGVANEIKTPEDLRRNIINVLSKGKLGEDYIDWHTDEGKCGLTLIVKGECFDMVITKRDTK